MYPLVETDAQFLPDLDSDSEAVVKNANGTVLSNGDAVVLIKNLKVKDSSITLKLGNGSFMLKAGFLKKV